MAATPSIAARALLSGLLTAPAAAAEGWRESPAVPGGLLALALPAVKRRR